MEMPPALARLGLTGIRDNLAPGQAVGGFARDFSLIFREEIEARVLAFPRPAAARKSPCHDSASSISASE